MVPQGGGYGFDGEGTAARLSHLRTTFETGDRWFSGPANAAGILVLHQLQLRGWRKEQTLPRGLVPTCPITMITMRVRVNHGV